MTPPLAVRRLTEEVFCPAHFFAAPTLALEWEHVEVEEVAWEVFRGRLLDPAHTRQRRSFESWNLYQRAPEGRANEPLLSLKWDAAAAQLHVVRGLDSYVWEGYDAGGNVYLSRERRRWVRELTGTVNLDRFADLDELRDELIGLLFRAVVGSSRLPLSSVEAPLPAFSFGELFYCYRPGATESVPLRSYPELVQEMLDPSLARVEQAKLLETFLHVMPLADLGPAARLFVDRWTRPGRTPADLAALLRTLFNEVSLSPWTDLTDRTLAFVRELERQHVFAAGEAIDFLGHLLRQTGRHLTAYDLVTFHHRGANYPDALLLDAVLKAYLARIEQDTGLFTDAPDDNDEARHGKRLRRRALRQGWLLRRRYEGHAVPDQPTSPGENSRVLPPAYPRVPEEQVLQPARRQRRLYADDPLRQHLGPRAAEVLRQSLLDLQHPEEARELGTALFLDRPFGIGKSPGEPDKTLLLATAAFSRTVAEQRVQALAREGELPDEVLRRCREAFDVPGVPLDVVGGSSRPGTVALTDARLAAPDFVFRRTTAAGVADLLAQYDFTPLAERFNLDYLLVRRRVVIALAPTGTGLLVYDEQFRPRLEMEPDQQHGYESRAGQEYPAGGLRVVRVWEETEDPVTLRPHDLRTSPVLLPPSA